MTKKIKMPKLRLPKVNLYAVEILLALGLLGVGIGMVNVPAALITLGRGEEITPSRGRPAGEDEG
jgi:hypothetical protein